MIFEAQLERRCLFYFTSKCKGIISDIVLNLFMKISLLGDIMYFIN